MKQTLFLLFLVNNLSAMDASFNAGKQVAEQKINGLENQIKSGRGKNEIPYYQDGVSISKDELSRSFEHLARDKHGSALRDIHRERSPYILDEQEAFMVRSEDAHQHPEREFEGTEAIDGSSGGYTIETCEECPPEEFFVKARKTKKRYVYLDKPPYIETSGARCNHGYLTVRVTIPHEPDDAFLEDGTFNVVYRGRTASGADTYEHFLVNGVQLDLKKTVLQNGAPWPNRGSECVMTASLHQFVLDSPDLIKALLGGSTDQTYNWGRIGTAHLHHRVVNDTGEHYWILDDACQRYEDLCRQGLCRYHKLEEDPSTDKFWKGKKVNGSWGQTVTFACRAACKDTCAQLRARGCSRQPNPECLEKVGTKCVRWRWKFKCQDRMGMAKHKFSKANPFCLGGDCIDSSYESDKDMIEAMGYLSILEEARKEMDGTANINIFKGKSYACTRFPISFKDCCGCGGWGVSLGLTGCDEDSKVVGKLNSEGKCIRIGTYCAEKVPILGTCLREKTVFCCFGSKFAKLLQEQGKPQLGMNFGFPQCPNCIGFTPEQLSQIDFSRLDLTEIAEDVMSKFKPQKGGHFAKGGELDRIRKQMQEKGMGSPFTEGQHLQENMRHLTGSMRTGGSK